MGRPKKKRPHVGNPEDPLALTPLLVAYLAHLELVNLSKWTIINHENALQFFLAWCNERGIGRATEVTRQMILQYQRYVFHERKDDGNPLGFTTQLKRVSSVIGMFKWLTRENVIPFNPATEIDLPKVPHRLPRYVLSPEEVDAVMSQPDLTDAIGVRDRAMLEILYSTGMRRGELMNLKLFDLDLDRGTIIVREGKGRRDRIIPIGERAIGWMQKYLSDVRPWFANDPDSMVVFLSHRGAPLSRNQISYTVRQYLKASGTGKQGACHLFRHAMATAMLENGADIRYIQQMLGHKSLQTTEIYTHVSIRKLKEIHAATHPSSRVRPRDEARSLPAIDHSAALTHVDDSISEQRAGTEPKQRRAVGSYALKVLRGAEREKRELLSSLAADSFSEEEKQEK
jgi:integrase/recombinase XerD